MEGRQEGRLVDRKEERKRGRHDGKRVTGRGRMVDVAGRWSRRKMGKNVGRMIHRTV